MSERDDRLHDCGVPPALLNAHHEGAVDLQAVHRQPGEVVQAGVAGPEVVDRDLDAQLLQGPQNRDRHLPVIDQLAFGQLQLQAARIDLMSAQGPGDGPHETRTAELHRRHIDPHLQIVMAGAVPGGELAATFAQRPVAQRLDQVRLFGDRDELPGRDPASLGVAPAHQGFDAADPAARDIDLRLIMQLQLPPRDRGPQCVLELDALGRLASHRRRVELEALSAARLDPVLGDVGVAQQRVEIVPVPRKHAGSDAQRYMDVVPFDRERYFEQFMDFARHVQHVVRARKIGRQHREGGGLQPGRGIAVAHCSANALADLPQQRVAGGAPVAVVDQLEAIEIKDDQGAGPANTTRVGHRLGGPVAEQAAVRKPRQRIVAGQIGDPLLVGLALADVAGDRRKEPYAAVGAAMRNDDLGNGDFLAFGIEHRRFALPQPVASRGRQCLVLDDFAHPSGIDLGAERALGGMLRHAGELAAGGIQVNAPSLRVGHADVIAGRLQDLHQAGALLLRRAHALAVAGLGQGAPQRGAEPAQIVLENVVGRAEPDRLDRPLLADRARNKDERHPRRKIPRDFQRRQAVEFRHREIGQDGVGGRALQRFAQLHFRRDVLPRRPQAVALQRQQRELDIVPGILDE